MQGIILIVAIGILTESLITYFKEIKDSPELLASIALGVGLSFLFDVRLFEFLGMEVSHYADMVLTGIIASRGSNYIYDLVGKMTQKKVNKI